MQYTSIIALLAGASMVAASPTYTNTEPAPAPAPVTCPNNQQAACCNTNTILGIAQLSCVFGLGNCGQANACCPGTEQNGIINIDILSCNAIAF